MRPKTGGRARRKANANARDERKALRSLEKAIGMADMLDAPPFPEGLQHAWVPAEILRVASLFPELIRGTKAVAEAVLAITAPSTILPGDRIEMLDAVPKIYRLPAWYEARARALKELGEGEGPVLGAFPLGSGDP